MNSSASAVRARIARLFVYPVKSCAGVEVREALLTETGLDLDRAWMVVDGEGRFVTQRQLPRMALVRPQIRHSEVVLRAPGMLALHLSIDSVEEPVKVRVWGDEVAAYDMGAVAAQWFTDFLGQPLRLVRFDPEQRRLSDARWTSGAEALNQFSDGFPLLVLGEAAVDELNGRLGAAGHAPVGIERFRPNIVLAGLPAHEEDRAARMTIAAAEPVELRLVKPCGRCPIPNIDPATGEVSPHVLATLMQYRRNDLIAGKAAFGMNAIVARGVEQTLRVGQQVDAAAD
ncbi:MOSC domain-containing protein [Ramlibacter sp. RBP-2]|uniref:MOSC domain-containing protein n=1 Tax=Ramlibacter lithotrophicus TaxID=2606681 RepID=A0A7X6I7Y6_9BURK|nr:MOSC N-terminal beta barrel domain-containing protein [Ramlibacter lithotrophicus]NKE67719.1 MOSC domain-containing protein [Ramlibacter lithotrophicus]